MGIVKKYILLIDVLEIQNFIGFVKKRSNITDIDISVIY
jgi:hypothetical protein